VARRSIVERKAVANKWLPPNEKRGWNRVLADITNNCAPTLIMRMNHAHVEAALAATIVMAIMAVIDLFADVMDGNPFKIWGYVAGFWIVYGVAYSLIRRQWNK